MKNAPEIFSWVHFIVIKRAPSIKKEKMKLIDMDYCFGFGFFFSRSTHKRDENGKNAHKHTQRMDLHLSWTNTLELQTRNPNTHRECY